jgi:hypothetical protein
MLGRRGERRGPGERGLPTYVPTVGRWGREALKGCGDRYADLHFRTSWRGWERGISAHLTVPWREGGVVFL